MLHCIMVNLLTGKSVWLFVFLCNLTGISLLPFESHLTNITLLERENKSASYQQGEKKDATTLKSSSDLSAAATDHHNSQLHLPVSAKPRGFNLPKDRSEELNLNYKTQVAAQNYYSSFLSELPPLDHTQPFYTLTEDPIIAKFIVHHYKQFPTGPQQFAAHDASILGSGDFGVLRGGTFYSDEEHTNANAERGDFYYGDASNTHAVASTESFIPKYTYPEEQFAQFKDFADIGTPADSAFSHYVVVYAAKNATSSRSSSKPKNIFEQLQEIDKEKALEQKKRRKNPNGSSVTKLKLVKTKQMEKKWAQRQPAKVVEADPLLALS